VSSPKIKNISLFQKGETVAYLLPSPLPCMLMRALPVHIAHETAGAARIRHSLRPLISRARMFQQNSRETRGEIADMHPIVVTREGGCDPVFQRRR